MENSMQLMVTRSAIAGAVAWGASLLGAVQYVASNQWAGARDMLGMMLWTVAFGTVISITAASLFSVLQAGNPIWGYAAAVLFGPALGIGSFWLAVALRGGWVVAFPVFTCWAFGGLAGLLVPPAITHPRSWLAAAGLAGAAFVILVWTHSVLRRLG